MKRLVQACGGVGALFSRCWETVKDPTCLCLFAFDKEGRPPPMSDGKTRGKLIPELSIDYRESFLTTIEPLFRRFRTRPIVLCLRSGQEELRCSREAQTFSPGAGQSRPTPPPPPPSSPSQPNPWRELLPSHNVRGTASASAWAASRALVRLGHSCAPFTSQILRIIIFTVSHPCQLYSIAPHRIYVLADRWVWHHHSCCARTTPHQHRPSRFCKPSTTTIPAFTSPQSLPCSGAPS